MSGYGCFKTKKSEGVAMASTSPADVSANQEPAEATEECPGKKKSKFQTFKKFFSRRRRKAPPGGDELKCSVSSDDLSKSRDQASLRAGSDKNDGSEVGLGSRAQSHDSVFASDWSENREALGASQDSLHGKVKNLQMQLKQAMRLGAPPSLLCVKRTEEDGTVSEDDGLPCSPPEYTPCKTKPQRNSCISLDSAEEQSSCLGSRAPHCPPVAAPGDFSSPASVSVCLDSSAARHKLGLRQRAQQQRRRRQKRRRPASRAELNSDEADSVLDDSVNDSTSIADSTGADAGLKVEDVEVTAELSPEETSTSNPDLDQDQGLNQDSEREQDSPGSSPEPPAGGREHLLDPLCLSESSLEEKLGEALSEGEEREREEEEEEEEEEAEGESSLLLEVLSSLKTPLNGLDVPLTDHHQRETEETQMAREEEETQEASIQPQMNEDKDSDAPEEDNQEVEPQPQEVQPEEQEIEADIQEVDVSFYKDADDDKKSVEEESEEEPEVEHFRPSELVTENTKEDFQEFHHEYKIVSVTQYSDSEEEEMQHDPNVIDKHISELNKEEAGKILDSIEQEVTENEEETQAAILVQEETQNPIDHDFKDETDENVEFEMQISEEVVKTEEDFEVEEELMAGETENCEIEEELKDSEEAEMGFESGKARIERNHEEEAAFHEEITDTEEKEKGDLTSRETSQRKTSTATLEINLASPTAEKHVRFSDSVQADGDLFDEMEGRQEEESEQTSMEEVEDMQELENLEKTESKVEFFDRIQDESIDSTLGEAEEPHMQETFGNVEKEVEPFDKSQEEKIPISESETPEDEGYGKLEKDLGVFDSINKIEDVVEVSMIETEEVKMEEPEEPKEEVGIFGKMQEEQAQVSMNEKQMCENVDVEQGNPEKQVSRPEPGRPRFTVATAWQRSLSIGEKDESGSSTAPKIEPENHKVPSEFRPYLETQQGQESRPEPEQRQESTAESPQGQRSRPEMRQVLESRQDTQQVQESRPETQQVQDPKQETHQVLESRQETQQVQVTKSKPDSQKVQESRPETQQVLESRQDTQQVQGSVLETHQVLRSKVEPETQEIQESRAEPAPETVREGPAAVEGISQNPFGVRLRRTQALKRFIAEDEQKQDVQTKKVEQPPSLSAKQPIRPKPTSTNQPITGKTPPLNPPITVKSPPSNPPVTVKSPPSNPPVTVKPSILNLPIANKPTATSPPVSAKPVVPRKPEVEIVNKLKRTSDAGSEPPSWISVAKHKQKVYKENSPVTNKDETEKKTQESSKVISLNLKPASPLSPPTPVPPVAPKSSHSCPSLASLKPLSSPSPLSSPGQSSPSSPPPRVASPQDEPPWMALAKKKAKAWSEMPQIVQ